MPKETKSESECNWKETHPLELPATREEVRDFLRKNGMESDNKLIEKLPETRASYY